MLDGTRSDRLRRLFDYLLERSLVGESPSEQQIASEAFSDVGVADSGPEANVRVYIHRLRKVLDTTFAGSQGDRLHIPIGEYCIRLVDTAEAAVLPDGSKATEPRRPWSRSNAFRAAALAAVLSLAAAAWFWLDREVVPLGETIAWEGIAGNARPITVVAGDYYLFARLAENADLTGQPPQLVLDRSVPTREDLTILQMLDSGKASAVVDYNQQFVSGGTIEALSTVRVGLAQLPKRVRRPVRLVAASQLTPELLGSTDIIYVGQFSGLSPLLRDPLAQASGFRIDRGFGGLIDVKSATAYQSDGMNLTDERIARRDFAYLASVPGPAGNRILVIAGVGDAGVKEAARIAGSAEQLGRLSRDAQRSSDGFEALYRVRTIKSVNVGAVLVTDRPLRSGGIWDNSGSAPAYRPIDVKPDSSSESNSLPSK